MKITSLDLRHIVLSCACSILLLSCGSSGDSGSSGSSSSSSSPNGRYTYTESGGVESVVTVSGTSWSATLKLCDYCDKSYESGIVKDGRLYDSTGYVEVGSISGSSLTMRSAAGNMTHRKWRDEKTAAMSAAVFLLQPRCTLLTVIFFRYLRKFCPENACNQVRWWFPIYIRQWPRRNPLVNTT